MSFPSCKQRAGTTVRTQSTSNEPLPTAGSYLSAARRAGVGRSGRTIFSDTVRTSRSPWSRRKLSTSMLRRAFSRPRTTPKFSACASPTPPTVTGSWNSTTSRASNARSRTFRLLRTCGHVSDTVTARPTTWPPNACSPPHSRTGPSRCAIIRRLPSTAQSGRSCRDAGVLC